MDSFAERLRSLTDNKYFAYLAVIFFAFLTALVFAIFAFQNTQTQQPDDIRRDAQQSSQQNRSGSSDSLINNTTTEPGTFNQDSNQSQNTDPSSDTDRSPLDRIIDTITGRNSSKTTNTDSSNTSSQSPGTQPQTGNQQADQAEVLDSTLRDSPEVPDIEIDKYVLTTEMPQKPQSINLFTLKTAYTEDEMQEMAAQMDFTNVQAIDRNNSLTVFYDVDNGHYMAFNEDGSYTYLSETGFAVDNPSPNALTTGRNILAQVGLADSTLEPYATYERTDDDGDYTYIEIHRTWDRMDAPVINPYGMLNIGEGDRIADLSLGSQQLAHNNNSAIVNTSDNADGKSRPDDFNTITIKYDPATSRVYGLSSNIPEILESETISANSIKSPIQAFDEYSKNKTSLGLVTPTGEGTANLNDIYSNNTARAQTVNVTDFNYIYPATMSTTPETWCPSYVFRSFGQVQTGFDSQFIHLVPAVDDPRCQAQVLGSSNNQLAQNNTGRVSITPITGNSGDSSSLKYGTKTFVVRVVEDTPVSECPTDFNHSYKLHETTDTVEYLAWIDDNSSPGRLSSGRIKPRQWYFVVKKKASSQLDTSIIEPTLSNRQVRSKRGNLIVKCTVGDVDDCPLDPRVESLETVSCKHITTASPWVYLYSDSQVRADVSINPVGDVAYVSPQFTDRSNRTWTVTTNDNGTLSTSDNLTKNALHWEYYQYDVSRAYRSYINENHSKSPGFVVATNQLKPFLTELYSRIGLQGPEITNAIAELERPSYQSDKPYTVVRFVDSIFVDEAFPISVSPQPDTTERVYIELQPRGTYAQLDKPELPQIERKGFTLIETGYIINR